MTLANPLALLWALAAIPVVLLYRRRMRLRRFEVGTATLWEQVFAEDRVRQAWHPWRHGVSLAVHLVALFFLVLALAEPLLPPPRRLAIVVDHSASMNATETEPSRLDRARQAASDMVRRLRRCDRAAVLSAGGSVGVRCGLSHHRESLLKAIAKVAPTQEATAAVTDAVDIARSLLAGAGGGRIVVLSDAQFSAAAELAAADDVDLVRVGKPTGNLAVARLELRRSPVDPLEAQALVEVHRFSDQPAAAQLEFVFNDRSLATETIRFDAGSPWRQVFTLEAAAGGQLTARLQASDALAADNQLTADVPPARRYRIVLRGRPNRFVESALEANPCVEFAPDDALPGSGAGEFLPIFVGEVPERLPEGPSIVIDPTGPCDFWQTGEPLGNCLVAGQDIDSPVLDGVSLVGTALPGAASLQLAEKARPLAQPLAWNAEGSPLMLAVDRPSGRVIVIDSGGESGRLPLSPAMPVLLANALQWVAGEEGDDGEAPGVAPAPGAAESDLRVSTDLGTHVDDLQIPGPGVPPWLVLVLAAVGLLAAEWCLYQRRWLA